MRTLEFNLIEWHEAYKQTIGFTSIQMRNFKKKYFKGTAFNAAFPLSNHELPQRWRLDGVVEIENGDEFEFSWSPDGTLTFSDLIKDSAVVWAKSMESVASAEYAVSIKCIAKVG